MAILPLLLRSINCILRQLHAESLSRHELRLRTGRKSIQPMLVSQCLELLKQLLLARYLLLLLLVCHYKRIRVYWVAHVRSWSRYFACASDTTWQNLLPIPAVFLASWRWAYYVNEALWARLIRAHRLDWASTGEWRTPANRSTRTSSVRRVFRMPTTTWTRISWSSDVLKVTCSRLFILVLHIALLRTCIATYTISAFSRLLHRRVRISLTFLRLLSVLGMIIF